MGYGGVQAYRGSDISDQSYNEFVGILNKFLFYVCPDCEVSSSEDPRVAYPLYPTRTNSTHMEVCR